MLASITLYEIETFIPSMADVAAVTTLPTFETLKPEAWRRQVTRWGNMRATYAVDTQNERQDALKYVSYAYQRGTRACYGR